MFWCVGLVIQQTKKLYWWPQNVWCISNPLPMLKTNMKSNFFYTSLKGFSLRLKIHFLNYIEIDWFDGFHKRFIIRTFLWCFTNVGKNILETSVYGCMQYNNTSASCRCRYPFHQCSSNLLPITVFILVCEILNLITKELCYTMELWVKTEPNDLHDNKFV